MEKQLTQKEKYEMFRQFMFNELHITKDDICTWIRDAVKEQCEKLVQQSFGKFSSPEEMVKEMIEKRVRESICNYNGTLNQRCVESIMKELANNFTLTLNSKV